MAYDFPASPAENQLFTPAGGPTYVYKAPRWMVQSSVAIADAPDSQNYVRTLGAWLRAYSKAEMDALLSGKADASAMTAADNLRVLKAGDTMTGQLNVTPTIAVNNNVAAGIATLYLDGGSGAGGSVIRGRKNLLPRWTMYLGGNNAEPGSDVGSDFILYKYKDDGATSATAMSISRADMSVNWGGSHVSLTVGSGTDGASAGGGINLMKRASGFSESIYAKDGAGGFSGMIGFDGTGQFLIRAGDNATNDVTVSTNGTITAIGNIAAMAFYASNSYFISQHASQCVLGMEGAGTVYLRPNGANVGTGQLSLSTAGNVSVAGQLTTGTNLVANGSYFIGSANTVVLGTAIGGTGQLLYLRPVAYNSATGQATLNTAGVFTVPSVSVNSVDQGAYSATGAGAGVSIANMCYISSTSTASVAMERFCNPNGIVGYIQASGTSTSFGTSSDETLKEFNAEYDPAEAIAIIRADPVLGFTWKATGEEAIGWFAQKSHAVDPNLASPPSYSPDELAAMADGKAAAKPGEDGYVPWGIDYGKRTPYLWAALSNVLDRLEALEAKLSITDPKPLTKGKKK